MTNIKRTRGIGVFLAVLLWLPAPAFSDGPCGCEDISRLEDRLKEREQLLEIARQVEREALASRFASAGWYKERFVEVAFPDGNYEVQGTQKHGEEITVSDELKASNCDGIWKATEAHELDHAEFDKTVPGWKYPWIMIFGQEGKFLARKEVSGYAAEVEYLKNELEKLKQSGDCEPEEPELERYQEMNQARREEQRMREQQAAKRVSRYAQSIGGTP
jgi:hypothetical protein